MSVVQIKCANCGALVDNLENQIQFRCSHCGALVLNIVDAELKDGVEIVTPEDLDNFLAENKQSFVINVGDRLEEFDIDTKVINKTITDAERLLSERSFGSYILNGCPDSLIVLRLKLLHNYEVCNEYELSMQSSKLQGEVYDKFISLCDETTKNTYKKIEEQIEKNIASDNEIKEVEKLWNVGLYEDALVYATQMLKKYPYKALAHARYILAKWDYFDYDVYKNVQSTYRTDVIKMKYKKEFNQDWEIMKRCPDYHLLIYYGQARIGKPFWEDFKDYYLKSLFLWLYLLNKDDYVDSAARKIVKDEIKTQKKQEKLQAKLAKKQAKLDKKGK